PASANFAATGQSSNRTLSSTCPVAGSSDTESCCSGHERCTWETTHAPPSAPGVIATGSARPCAREPSSMCCATSGTRCSPTGATGAPVWACVETAGVDQSRLCRSAPTFPPAYCDQVSPVAERKNRPSADHTDRKSTRLNSNHVSTTYAVFY